MRLQKYLITRLVTNPYNIGSSLTFMIFWLIMGAFVFRVRVPSLAARAYTSTWF